MTRTTCCLGLASLCLVAHGAAQENAVSPDANQPRPAWKVEGNEPFASFGTSVGTAGDVNGDGWADVVVGALGIGNGGTVLAYYGSAKGPAQIASWRAEGDEEAVAFGISAGTAGDVNGDGFDDVIVGATQFGIGGAAFVFHGSAAGLSETRDWMAVTDQDIAFFGRPVGTAGDVNGDGYDDVIVGAWNGGDPGVRQGQAYAYYGSPAGLSLTHDWSATGELRGGGFGASAGTAGDVNGDGYDDVIVGERVYSRPESGEGKALVYYGSPSGLSMVADWTVESNQREATLGAGVATAGDVNGDGYDDVVVGAPGYPNGDGTEGQVWGFYGSPSGPSATPDWIVLSDQAESFFGLTLASAGDLNGDGYDDVVVGAYQYNDGNGRIYVYYGSAAGLSTTPKRTAGREEHDLLGYSLGTAGDVNRDGYDELIVGAIGFTHPERGEGIALMFRDRR